MAIQCLFKYCFKGYDCALGIKNVEVSESIINNDTVHKDSNYIEYEEINHYIKTGYVSPPEATFILLAYHIYELSHAIYELAVHIENEKNFYFFEGSEEKILHKNVATTFTAWCNRNEKDPKARDFLHREIPDHSVFKDSRKSWVKKEKNNQIFIEEDVLNESSGSGTFFLRLLLLYVRKSKTVNYR